MSCGFTMFNKRTMKNYITSQYMKILMLIKSQMGNIMLKMFKESPCFFTIKFSYVMGE